MPVRADDHPGREGDPALGVGEAALQNLLKQYTFEDPVYVTSPSMPDREKFERLVSKIWDTKLLTNNGPHHQELERRLAEFFGVEHLSVFCNGTVALLVALHALRINSGEVITTPFTFPATAHVLYWNRLRPVFCDIDPATCNLDPRRLEGLIGPETRAILPVHVYGNPCDIDTIESIANRHGLQVIYDAAHTFGAKYRGKHMAAYGDMAMLSFHATKLFTTVEGGALVMQSKVQKERVDFLKNFGITGREKVIGPGINGKLNEFQAAFGLLQLDMIEEEIANRGKLVDVYRDGLGDIPGIRQITPPAETTTNNAYFPIFVEEAGYGLSRDALDTLLRRFNVNPRKYFFPLCSNYACYAALPSASAENLPAAEKAANEVLCLPLFGSLPVESAAAICAIIRELHRAAVKD